MLTKDLALSSNEFHFGECTRSVGPRGGVTIKCEVWRRNGATQTWKSKSRVGEYRVPVKHGMYDYGQITHREAGMFHVASECPLNGEVNNGR